MIPGPSPDHAPHARRGAGNLPLAGETVKVPRVTDTFTDEAIQDAAEDLPPIDDEPQSGTGEWTGPDLSFLDSPDFADFMRRPKTATARDYEKRTASALKTVMMGLLQNPSSVPDAANIIYHGTNVSAAAGMLADADKRAARFLDIITTPENPYILFAVAMVPFISQFVRNHEGTIESAPARFKQRRKLKKEGKLPPSPAATITIPVIKKKIKVPFRLHFRLSVFRSQSLPPEEITQRVFSDDKVRRELRKLGVRIGE